MTKDKLHYILTGTEEPLFLTEREKRFVEKTLSIINEKEEEIKKLRSVLETIVKITEL